MTKLLNDSRGSSTVEFALVLPLLVLLLCGIIDFGRLYNARLTLSHAAREAVRTWSLGGTPEQTATAAQSAAVGLSGVTAETTVCEFGSFTTVTVEADFVFLTPLIADIAPGVTSLSTDGVMRCGG